MERIMFGTEAPWWSFEKLLCQYGAWLLPLAIQDRTNY